MKNLIKTFGLILFISVNSLANTKIEKKIDSYQIKQQNIHSEQIAATINVGIELFNLENNLVSNATDTETLYIPDFNDFQEKESNVSMMDCSNSWIVVEGQRIGYARTCCIGSWCSTREVFFQ